MMIRITFLSALAAALALAGCGGDGSPIDLLGGGQEPLPPVESLGIPLAAGPGINGRHDWFGAQSAGQLDVQITARDQRGWEILWQLVGEPPPGELPEGSMALAIFLGSRPTGGYTVAFDRVTRQDGLVVAGYRETTPPPDALVSQAFTAPYAIRLVQADSAPVQFVPALPTTAPGFGS
ncbi:MAG: protease complex subunit PrcB family protein [Inquilinus sp.]|nr:protease complex subunit PrcB family protein [Inquilinus sp.]